MSLFDEATERMLDDEERERILAAEQSPCSLPCSTGDSRDGKGGLKNGGWFKNERESKVPCRNCRCPHWGDKYNQSCGASDIISEKCAMICEEYIPKRLVGDF